METKVQVLTNCACLLGLGFNPNAATIEVMILKVEFDSQPDFGLNNGGQVTQAGNGLHTGDVVVTVGDTSLEQMQGRVLQQVQQTLARQGTVTVVAIRIPNVPIFGTIYETRAFFWAFGSNGWLSNVGVPQCLVGRQILFMWTLTPLARFRNCFRELRWLRRNRFNRLIEAVSQTNFGMETVIYEHEVFFDPGYPNLQEFFSRRG